MICTAKGADHIRKRLCLVIICQIKSLSVECCESSFPSIEAVSLNGLSNDLNLIERSCAGIVEASGDGNGLEHSGGISTSGQSAVVLQDELRIKLTNGENIASFNADNAPAFAQVEDVLRVDADVDRTAAVQQRHQRRFDTPVVRAPRSDNPPFLSDPKRISP